MATGEIEREDDKTLVIKRVHVAYRLVVNADADRDAIERAHEHHATKCPVYRSIHPQIQCSTSLELVEGG